MLFGEIPPYRLVRLSNESIGSGELARWHEPEMVKVLYVSVTHSQHFCIHEFYRGSLLALESHHKGSSAPFLRSPMVDENG